MKGNEDIRVQEKASFYAARFLSINQPPIGASRQLEQDHRGIKGRYRPMRGFKCPRSAARFCRGYDELRYFLRRSVNVLAILEVA